MYGKRTPYKGFQAEKTKKISTMKDRGEVKNSLELLSVGQMKRLAQKNHSYVYVVVPFLVRKYKKDKMRSVIPMLESLSNLPGEFGKEALRGLDEIKKYEENRPPVNLNSKAFTTIGHIQAKNKRLKDDLPKKKKNQKLPKRDRFGYR